MADILSGLNSFPTQTTASAVAESLTEAETDEQGLASDFDDFLLLLTTQLQNQDPLDPDDSSEFTNQLVQFSQVEQQIKSNERLEELVTLQDLSLTSIALGYIGMNVEIPGQFFDHAEGVPYEFSYDLPAGGASAVNYTILDEDNQPLFEGRGTIDGGKNKIVWDGTDGSGNPLPAGNYRIALEPLDGEGEIIEDAQTNVTVLVDGVETVDGQLMLTAGNQFVSFNNILSASTPPTL